MKTLISPREVLELAFGRPNTIAVDQITETVILSAQAKFLEPVLGDFYPKLIEERSRLLLEEYIKPALAYYVKLLLIPTFCVSVGQMGLVQQKGVNFSAATKEARGELYRITRAKALGLMKRAVAHIESNPESYPGYKAVGNVLNRVSMTGGVLLD